VRPSPARGFNFFAEGNEERFLQKVTKKTKAVVDLKKPSLPSFSSVDFCPAIGRGGGHFREIGVIRGSRI